MAVGDDSTRYIRRTEESRHRAGVLMAVGMRAGLSEREVANTRSQWSACANTRQLSGEMEKLVFTLICIFRSG